MRDLEIIDGENAIFECDVTHDDVHGRWYLNDKALTENDTTK